MAACKVLYIICKVSCTSNFYIMIQTPLIIDLIPVVTEASVAIITVLGIYKMLSYRRETALQGTLVLAESGRLELRDNILLIL